MGVDLSIWISTLDNWLINISLSSWNIVIIRQSTLRRFCKTIYQFEFHSEIHKRLQTLKQIRRMDRKRSRRKLKYSASIYKRNRGKSKVLEKKLQRGGKNMQPPGMKVPKRRSMSESSIFTIRCHTRNFELPVFLHRKGRNL